MLVARSAERLERVASELRTRGAGVEVLAADLADRDQLARVEARLTRHEAPVSMLVNNAGSGLRAPFDQTSIDDEQHLLDVLVTAPMRLAHAALPGMLERGAGVVLNVASVAAYTPRGTYGAAKSWLLAFSRSAHIAYRGRGVIVSAVAPGFVHTEFHSRMGASKEGIPQVLWLDPEYVVRIALRAADRRRSVSIPSLRYRLIAGAARVLPDRIAAAGTLRPR